MPRKSALELVGLVRQEVLRRAPHDYAAFVAFTVLRLPESSGDWLVQPRFDVPDAYLPALEEAARVVRQRFRLAPLPMDEGAINE